MRRERQNLIIAYKLFFSSDEGKLILADLRKKAPMVTEGINTKSGIDVNVLMVEEGRADVVKYIYKMAGRDPLEEKEEFAQTGE